MDNTLSVFNFESNSVRVVLVNNEPWFVAKDVCDILGLSDVSMTCSRLREKDKGTSSICTPSGNQQVTIISEFGLYELVLGSRKEEAKQFKYWLCDEVLPSIRKTGSYRVPVPVEQPKLPSEVKALNIAKAVAEIQDLISYNNPRLAQFLIDHAISDIMPSQSSLTGSKLKGVVEIAEELGYKVNFNNRSALGKFVKKLCGELAVLEERLVNGTSRKVACYPMDSEEVRLAIHNYFNK